MRGANPTHILTRGLHRSSQSFTSWSPAAGPRFPRTSARRDSTAARRKTARVRRCQTAQAQVEQLILDLATALEDADLPDGMAGIGMMVALRDQGNGDELDFTLMEPLEAEPDRDLISVYPTGRGAPRRAVRRHGKRTHSCGIVQLSSHLCPALARRSAEHAR
jgi:hypothetical protein